MDIKASMNITQETDFIPAGYQNPRKRHGRKSGILLNISIMTFLFVLSYSYLQLTYSTTIILGLGVIGIWRHGWGIMNYSRAMRYKTIQESNKKTHLSQNGSLVIVVTFYNQTNEEVSAVSRALAHSIKSLPLKTHLVCAHLTENQKHIFKRTLNGSQNTAINFVRQHGLGKREALADCLSIAKASYSQKTREKANVLLIDGDTIVTRDAIEQSIAHLQQDKGLGAVVVNEIPYTKGSEIFNQWRMLRSLERNKLMCSFALSGRVLVLTGRFCMYRGDIILQTDVINRLRKDFLRVKNLHISLLTGDDKTTWLEVLRRRKTMLYLPFSYIYPIETQNQDDGFIKSTYNLSNRYSGNMARANLHKDAWVGVKKTLHFGYGLFDQRISMWTSLLTPLLLLYLLTFEHFGIFIVALTYALLIKHVQALALYSLGKIYDPWYPYLIFYNQIMTALIKVRAFAYLHRQTWTNQKISSQENSATIMLDKRARDTVVLRSFMFLTLFSLVYFLLR